MNKQRMRVEMLKNSPMRCRRIALCNISCTLLGYAAYVAMLLNRFFSNWLAALQLILITAVPFGVVTLLRALLDLPRPYERWGIEPLLPHRGQGHSFPSRHVFSMALIATIACTLHPILGGVLFGFTALLAYCRYITGMHDVRDIVAGWVLGIGLGVVGLIVLQYS